ncbi:FAD-dependent oxidoreductase [Streptomyces sp. NPDC049881]|uniref:NAD(P)/FAD-dependent oxidoreductase n=1 Tax=Streptomyces sp. NPDC049881 TaxID=3155778 RepID=UPI00342CA5CE
MRTVIVGGGVAGAALAWRLAGAGAAVTVVEESRRGAATLAGAGIVKASAAIRPAPYADLFGRAVAHHGRLMAELADEGAGDLGHRAVGGLWVSRDPAELDRVEALLRERPEDETGTVSRVDGAELRELFPVLAPDLAGLHTSRGARVDGRLLRVALLTAAGRRGASVVTGRAELRLRGGRAEALVDGLALPADEVVVAAGAWSGELLRPCGIDLGIRPQRGQISHLGLPDTDTSAWPAVSAVRGHYLLAFDDSRVVAGATREEGTGFDERVTAAGQAEVLREALETAPGLAGATLIETRVGFRPVSRDGLPLAGRLPGTSNLSTLTGYGPSGLALSPWLADRWATALLTGETPPDLECVSPHRPDAVGELTD